MSISKPCGLPVSVFNEAVGREVGGDGDVDLLAGHHVVQRGLGLGGQGQGGDGDQGKQGGAAVHGAGAPVVSVGSGGDDAATWCMPAGPAGPPRKPGARARTGIIRASTLAANATRMDRANPATPSPWRLSVAPMMDWTDRHCRRFHRLISRHARLYTEMVTTGALRHGDVPRHLDFNDEEHPVALQLGGSEPDELAHGARLAQQWGYDEVNLNCGCPSERVQRGAFGACLMNEAALVRDGVKAMCDATSLPVTVKHRIGLGRDEQYGFVRDFIGTVAEGGCSVFIVHARNAWLEGLSPKENREVPPLRHEVVYRLKRDFPGLTIVLNGGVTNDAQIDEHLAHVDGVMLGREAYHRPWCMADWDRRFFGDTGPGPTQAAVEQAFVDYLGTLAGRDVPWSAASRHMLGLWHGAPGARRWRQVWSDHRLKHRAPAEVAELARRMRALLSCCSSTATCSRSCMVGPRRWWRCLSSTPTWAWWRRDWCMQMARCSTPA